MPYSSSSRERFFSEAQFPASDILGKLGSLCFAYEGMKRRTREGSLTLIRVISRLPVAYVWWIADSARSFSCEMSCFPLTQLLFSSIVVLHTFSDSLCLHRKMLCLLF